MRSSRAVAGVLLIVLVVPDVLWALGSKKAMYVGGTLPEFPVKLEGTIALNDPDDLVFLSDKAIKRLAISWGAIEDLEYGQRVSRRWKTAVFLTVFALFSRGRKHYVTITYKTASGDQAAIFEIGKEAIRPTLAALKARSGKKLKCQDKDAVEQMGGTCDTVLPPEPAEGDEKK
ncbi:MAG TPA: hypothetical protein VFQ51_20640 [Vicinamibacteria bacterium]|nr:hypothetical protein [Vicinamibacteria bacterium]